MKKLILFLCLVFAFPLFSCASVQNNTSTIPDQIVTPDVETDNDNSYDDTYDKDEEEQKKKKQYAVSTVNSLRVRSSANSNSTVLGYLDKNDAVLILEQTNGFYKTIFKEKTAYVSTFYCTLMEIEYLDDKIENAIDLGSSLLGYPYVWGSQRYHWGNGKLNSNFKNGEFDCSALVQYVYYISNNVILDVTTRTQVLNGTHVERKDLTRGDLMFFTNESRKNKTGTERIGHVGIYFGNNYILHTASDHAVIEPISQTRWNYYITARRVV